MKKHLVSPANLGWEIALDIEDGAGTISSNLAEVFGVRADLKEEDEWMNGESVDELKGSMHAIESLVLALYCEGFQDWQGHLAAAIDTTVEAICNNFD